MLELRRIGITSSKGSNLHADIDLARNWVIYGEAADRS